MLTCTSQDSSGPDGEAATHLAQAANYWGHFFHFERSAASTPLSPVSAAPTATSFAGASTAAENTPAVPDATESSPADAAQSSSVDAGKPCNPSPVAECGEPTLFEQLLFDHSVFVVPHLDTLACKPLAHRYATIPASDPRLGLHFHR